MKNLRLVVAVLAVLVLCGVCAAWTDADVRYLNDVEQHMNRVTAAIKDASYWSEDISQNGCNNANLKGLVTSLTRVGVIALEAEQIDCTDTFAHAHPYYLKAMEQLYLYSLESVDGIIRGDAEAIAEASKHMVLTTEYLNKYLDLLNEMIGSQK